MRTILDRNLERWEVFANPGDFGFPNRAHLVFHCLSDLGRRPRYVELERDKAAAERDVLTLKDAELVKLLEDSDAAD